MSPISSLLACLKLILCGFLNKLSSGCLKANFSAYKIFASQFFSLRILNHFFSVLWQKVLLKSLMKSNPISYINHVLFIKIVKGFLFFFRFLFLYYNMYFLVLVIAGLYFWVYGVHFQYVVSSLFCLRNFLLKYSL